jgi:DNA repair exonuclease SbcCD ATPase subunit
LSDLVKYTIVKENMGFRRSQDAREPVAAPRPNLWQKFLAATGSEKASVTKAEMSRLDRLRQVPAIKASASGEPLRRHKLLDQSATAEMTQSEQAALEALFAKSGNFLMSLSHPYSDVRQASQELANYKQQFQNLAERGLDPSRRQRVAGMLDDLKGAEKYLQSYLDSSHDMKWATLLASPQRVDEINFYFLRFNAFQAPKTEEKISFKQAQWLLRQCSDLLAELKSIRAQMATKPPSLMVDDKLAGAVDLLKAARSAEDHLLEQKALLENRLAN